MDKVTTDEELEEMLHRDNLAIFISDVSGISVLGHKNAMQKLVFLLICVKLLNYELL